MSIFFTRLRVVAAGTTEWVCPIPPPIVSLAHLDIMVPNTLLTFSGSQYRALNHTPSKPFPSLALLLAPEALELHALGNETDFRELIHNKLKPDYIVAHGAANLRMLLPQDARHGDWICTQRLARQVWPDAPSIELRSLLAWRGLDDAPNARWGLSTYVTETAMMTAILLLDILETYAGVFGLHVHTTDFMWPAPAPDLADDIGWAGLGDDDLTWLARIGNASDQPVRTRAAAEAVRRREGGWATPLLGQPPNIIEGGEEGDTVHFC